MNDPLKAVERLAAYVRVETAFPLDVSDQVLSRIRQVPCAPVWPVVGVIAGVVVIAGLISPLVELFADPWSACFVLFAGG